MENFKKKMPLGRKKGWLWKFYGEIIPKELMFQRFTSVFDGYTCFYVIMYSISMDSAYKPFHCKAAADYFFSSLGASALWLPSLWCFLNRFSFIWDIGIKIPTAERRHSGLQASKEETKREWEKNII